MDEAINVRFACSCKMMEFSFLFFAFNQVLGLDRLNGSGAVISC